jgi:hypothetical protein
MESDQKTSCPERQEHDGRSGVVLHLIGKLDMDMDMTQNIVLHHDHKSVTSHRKFFKQERADNFVSHQSASHTHRIIRISSYTRNVPVDCSTRICNIASSEKHILFNRESISKENFFVCYLSAQLKFARTKFESVMQNIVSS